MILCNNCYQKRGLPAGDGRKWLWSLHKKDKWGKNLKERESCSECHRGRCLLTETTTSGEWRESPKKRFWKPMKLILDTQAIGKAKIKEKPQWLLDRMEKYARQ